jgi:hypothetical protein
MTANGKCQMGQSPVATSVLLVRRAYDPRLYRTLPRLQARVVFGHMPMAVSVYQADNRSVSIRYGTPIRSAHDGARASDMQRLMTADTFYVFRLLGAFGGLPARRAGLA